MQTKTKKRRAGRRATKELRRFEIDPCVLRFFPKTSRMGAAMPTGPWGELRAAQPAEKPCTHPRPRLGQQLKAS
jgi:hypothetical protein